MTENGFKLFQPTRAQRFWKALGFALAPTCPVVEDRLGYAPGAMSIYHTIRFSWGDRIRVLVSGHIAIGSSVQTTGEVRGAFTTSKTSVMAPGS